MPYAPDLAGCALDGRYELHELIGEGTFGRVYRGYDRRLARPVAIKVIKPWWAEDPGGAESFEREAQLLARVSDPGIVQIFDVGQADEGLYFVTELVEGESLAARLKRGGPLAAWDACDIAEQLCRALEHAHAEHIVHRDIKPANVLISDRGQVKVGDLGIARLAEGSTDGGTATIVGTPRYMAPEQASGQPVTPATDVYSAGVVLYEMLAGRTPFGGESAVEIALQHVQMSRCRRCRRARRGRSSGSSATRSPRTRPTGTRARWRWPTRSPGPGRARAGAGTHSETDTDTHSEAPAATGESAPHRASEDWWAYPTEVRDATTRIVARDARTRVAGDVDRTRVAPKMRPRRTANPAARRRTVAVFVLALAVLGALLFAAKVLTARPTVTLPRLHGMTQNEVTATLHRHHLNAAFDKRFDAAKPGTVVAQTPAPAARVKEGSTIQVVLSKGPKPVQVPRLTGQSATSASATLRASRTQPERPVRAGPRHRAGRRHAPIAGRGQATEAAQHR